MFDETYQFELGKAVIVREGSDVTLISTGVQTARTLEAARSLAGQGIDAHVIHVLTLEPLDTAAIVEAASRTGLVATVEEHSIIGGLGGAVAAKPCSVSFPAPGSEPCRVVKSRRILLTRQEPRR